MEEILASIRKIISEDESGESAQPASELRAADIAVTEIDEDDEALSLESLAGETRPEDDDMFEEFDLSDLDEVSDAAQPDEAALEDVPDLEPEPEEVLATQAEPESEPELDDILEASTRDALDDLMDADVIENDDMLVDDFDLDDTSETPAPTPTPVAAAAPIQPKIEPAPTDEDVAMQSLTEDKTADAAAGALARLVSKMDMGSENTLEGMVRELLKPMIKEWLDANLPGIVEDKVEAEVQRIARLAR